MLNNREGERSTEETEPLILLYQPVVIVSNYLPACFPSSEKSRRVPNMFPFNGTASDESRKGFPATPQETKKMNGHTKKRKLRIKILTKWKSQSAKKYTKKQKLKGFGKVDNAMWSAAVLRATPPSRSAAVALLLDPGQKRKSQKKSKKSAK